MKESFYKIHEEIFFKKNSVLKLFDNIDYKEYPKHWHAAVEIIMPINNPYNVECSNKNYIINEKDILIISPGVVHTMKAQNGKRLILQVDFELLNCSKDLESIFSLISPTLLITSIEEPNIHQLIHHLIMEIFNEFSRPSHFNEAMIYSKIIEMFVIIGRNYISSVVTTETTNQKHREYIEKFIYICAYIKDHSHENLSLDDISMLTGYSKYHFSRLFKQFTNVTFYNYLSKIRIENACILLIHKNLSITNIAFSCGFNSLSGFLRMFKLIKSCTPTEFRSLHLM